MGCSQQNSTAVGSATGEVAASRLHTWGPSYLTDRSDTGSSFPELTPALRGAEELARPPAAVQVYWQASGVVRSAGSAFQSSWKKQRRAQGNVCPAIPAGRLGILEGQVKAEGGHRSPKPWHYTAPKSSTWHQAGTQPGPAGSWEAHKPQTGRTCAWLAPCTVGAAQSTLFAGSEPSHTQLCHRPCNKAKKSYQLPW